jgi:hypothetical protein
MSKNLRIKISFNIINEKTVKIVRNCKTISRINVKCRIRPNEEIIIMMIRRDT